jgi:hypothetical protein
MHCRRCRDTNAESTGGTCHRTLTYVLIVQAKQSYQGYHYLCGRQHRLDPGSEAGTGDYALS